LLNCECKYKGKIAFTKYFYSIFRKSFIPSFILTFTFLIHRFL